MMTTVRCSVAVEVKGRPIHGDKSAKEHGIQVTQAAFGLPQVRVLGFKREIRLGLGDVRQFVDNRVSEGRLALVTKDGMQVVASKAQPAQLEIVLSVLRGKAPGLGLGCLQPQQKEQQLRPVATPMVASLGESKLPPRKLRRAVCSSGASSSCGSVNAGALLLSGDGHRCDAEVDGCSNHQVDAAISLCSLPQHVLSLLLEFQPATSALLRLAETCSQLDTFSKERRPFRLGPAASGVGLDPKTVVHALARHAKHAALTVVDLSGFTELTASATVQLAEVLGCELQAGVRDLRLRGCKALSDVAVRRLLLRCPSLEVLDVLEIPRLSNRALDAPLAQLRILAAGTLGRPPTAELRVPARADTNLSTGLGTVLASPKQRAQGSTQFSSAMLARLAQRPCLPEDGPLDQSSGGAPLTHAILPCCPEFQVLPQLPPTLRHLDLRSASLQMPEAAVAKWRPLARCPHLNVLCLAGNTLLSSSALIACIRSLPGTARLRALDLSNTQAEIRLAATLPQIQPWLTHLRLAGCTGLSNAAVAGLLSSLQQLEVLDIACCAALEQPLATLAPASRAGQAGAAVRLRLLGIGQTDFATYLDSSRRALAAFAPNAVAVNGSLDLFGGYGLLPPEII